MSYWTKENKAIGQQFDSGQKIDELLTSQKSSFATTVIGILLTVKMLCIYCIAFI